jgi:hypothetical protein
MVEILKNGSPWKYKTTCNECFCEFLFINEDMLNDSRGESNCVLCPCCGKVLQFNKKDSLYSATCTASSGTTSLT